MARSGTRGLAIVAACAAAVGLCGTSTSAAPAAAAPVAAALSGQAIYQTARSLVGMAPRATGSPGGQRAADYVAARFRGAGLDSVYVDEVTSYDWQASDYRLSVGTQSVPAHPVAHSFVPERGATGVRTTGPGGRVADVVDIGAGRIDGQRVRGKIVLFDLAFYLPTAGLLPLAEYINDPDGVRFNPTVMLSANPYLTSLETTIRAAQRAGAVGFVGVLRDYFNSNRYHNELYRRLAITIPGMWVTRADGARLRGLLRTRGNTARIDLTIRRRAVVGRTVVGILQGRSRDTVMVQSHHDSVGPGAVEDATGTAEVIALADHYGAARRTTGRRAKTLMFITFDTHFTGYQAHRAFVDKYITRRATPYRIVANTTIEHVGKFARRAANGTLVTTSLPEPKGIFDSVSLPLKAFVAQTLSRRNVRATTMLNATPFELSGLGIPTDASFVLTAGIPIVSFIAGPLYMYDDADTLDKIDRSQLRPVALFYRDVVNRLDSTPSDQIGLLRR